MSKLNLDMLEGVAKAACQDAEVWESVDLVGFDPADREFAATCSPPVVLLLITEAREQAKLRQLREALVWQLRNGTQGLLGDPFGTAKMPDDEIVKLWLNAVSKLGWKSKDAT